ncbi:replication protein A 14 kDa subunit isoform X1 [Amphiprion ocellaris]|uniref:Replication protein A C-terminal domain-containing protein n=1 Tax=Amphiprion ocellaris TaxID=80972 RepID=A0A3Q1BFG3_AMPOC|nr:replication protein A 14 kDa subunit isoform X1 [Amphiprion ocellaris]
MAGMLDVPKPRINCSMLSQHISRAVCFVGRVEKVHPTGKTFSVSDGEGNNATVELNEPVTSGPRACHPNGPHSITKSLDRCTLSSHQKGATHLVAKEIQYELEEELSGIVEVIGMVSNKGAIMATTYDILREDKGTPFDLELYNEAVKLIHDFPQHYPFEVAASG